MTNAQYFVTRWESEQKAFRNVLAAIPKDKLDYRPHERSTSAGDLAWQLAVEQNDFAELLEHSKTAYIPGKRPPGEDFVSAWDNATVEVRKRLQNIDPAKWDGPAKFLVGDQVAWEDTLQNIMWGFLFDMVHHRGQLSAYLRPMGGKVPAIYGPSADDRGE